MKQVVRKSTIPLYAAAATWLLYALLFPLYRPLHYVLAAGAAAVIGVVARLLCPNTVEEVPEEALEILQKVVVDSLVEEEKPMVQEEKMVHQVKRVLMMQEELILKLEIEILHQEVL